MRDVRKNLVGLALVAALGLAAGGCANGAAGGAATAPQAAADPKQALIASTAELQKGNFTFSKTEAQGTSKGSVHLPSRSSRVDMQTKAEKDAPAGSMHMLLVGEDRYVKMKFELAGMDLPSEDELKDMPEMAEFVKTMTEKFSGKTWSHIDLAKVHDDKLKSTLNLENPDVTGSTALLSQVVSAQRGADGGYTGTIDATKVPAALTPWTDKDMTTSAEQLKALPFTATLDGQGRLLTFMVDVPKIGNDAAHKMATTITGYGTATAQSRPPAAEITEAGEDMYKIVNEK
jgi:hypothetical protein